MPYIQLSDRQLLHFLYITVQPLPMNMKSLCKWQSKLEELVWVSPFESITPNESLPQMKASMKLSAAQYLKDFCKLERQSFRKLRIVCFSDWRKECCISTRMNTCERSDGFGCVSFLVLVLLFSILFFTMKRTSYVFN